MLTREESGSIVVDANVLIDYRESDLGVLHLVARHLGRIVVPDIVLEEVDDVDESIALAHGITVVETPLDALATTSRGSMSLSLPDRACLELARRNSWRCSTNDKPPRRACRERGIETLWGLELTLRLVWQRALPRQRAVAIGKAMHDTNPRSITADVLSDFLEKLRTEPR